MIDRRPSDKDLIYVGFTELQRILLRDLPDYVVRDAYVAQLEALMSDGDEDIAF